MNPQNIVCIDVVSYYYEADEIEIEIHLRHFLTRL